MPTKCVKVGGGLYSVTYTQAAPEAVPIIRHIAPRAGNARFHSQVRKALVDKLKDEQDEA